MATRHYTFQPGTTRVTSMTKVYEAQDNWNLLIGFLGYVVPWAAIGAAGYWAAATYLWPMLV